MKKISLIVIGCMLLGGIIVMGFFGIRKAMDYRIEALQTETSESPAFVAYDTLYYRGNRIEFDQLTGKNTESVAFKEVVVIKDERIWFVCQGWKKDTEEERWHLASVAQDGSDFQTHYCAEFGGAEDRWFYNDGQIVLSDGIKLVEYDMESGTAEERTASDHAFPTELITAEIKDAETIVFANQGENKQFTVADGEKGSAVFRTMMTWRGKKTAVGDSYLVDLFDNVQMVGEKIYIICRVLNWHGETYALIYEYDIETNTCKYAGSYFMGDVIGSHLYLVEEVE
ncbi:MAG: hypothetical protein IJA58_03040 [Lachnospiraceae bacterium]|nr:hypothetical protein [Lachnospiraceae bacterium]